MDSDKDSKKWIAIYTKPRYEKTVEKDRSVAVVDRHIQRINES